MAERHGARVLLVGCGQVGSRHLQAVATLTEVAEIDVVDPRAEALTLGQARLAEVPDRNPRIRVRWLSSLETASRGGDLCIVATQAEGRCRLVTEVAERLNYSSFLLEKPAGQSIQEIELLEALLRGRGCSAWVNMKDRAYPIHRRIKQWLPPGEPILFSVMGGNHGLASNGVHLADLFVFYDGAAHIELVASRIDPVLHPSKRGAHLFDLSGTLLGATEKGSRFILSYANGHRQSELLAITSRRYRCLIDQNERRMWVVENTAQTGGAWQPVACPEDLRVSQMTKQFAAEILNSGACALPTLQESLVGHRFILGALQGPFAELLQRETELCPVT